MDPNELKPGKLYKHPYYGSCLLFITNTHYNDIVPEVCLGGPLYFAGKPKTKYLFLTSNLENVSIDEWELPEVQLQGEYE